MSSPTYSDPLSSSDKASDDDPMSSYSSDIDMDEDSDSPGSPDSGIDVSPPSDVCPFVAGELTNTYPEFIVPLSPAEVAGVADVADFAGVADVAYLPPKPTTNDFSTSIIRIDGLQKHIDAQQVSNLFGKSFLIFDPSDL